MFFSWLEHVKTIIFHGEIAMDLEISGLDQGCEQLLRGLAIRISLLLDTRHLAQEGRYHILKPGW